MYLNTQTYVYKQLIGMLYWLQKYLYPRFEKIL